MKSGKLAKRIITCTIVGTFLISGGIVLADTDFSSNEPSATFSARQPKENKGGFQTFLEQMVDQSIMTQEQADQFTTWLENKQTVRERSSAENGEMEKPGFKGERIDIFAEAADSGIITQQQADALKEAQEQMRPERSGNFMQQQFEAMQNDGVITQQEAEAIKAYFEQNIDRTPLDKSRQENLSNMTDSERQAYFDNMRQNRDEFNIWDQLVDVGILSQDRADAVKQYCQEHMPEKLDIESYWQKLVDEGTVTSQQLEAIMQQIQNQKEQMKNEMESIKDMTDAERDSYIQQHKSQRENGDTLPNPWQDLVDNGTITQEQADKISPHPGNGGFERRGVK